MTFQLTMLIIVMIIVFFIDSEFIKEKIMKVNLPFDYGTRLWIILSSINILLWVFCIFLALINKTLVKERVNILLFVVEILLMVIMYVLLKTAGLLDDPKPLVFLVYMCFSISLEVLNATTSQNISLGEALFQTIKVIFFCICLIYIICKRNRSWTILTKIIFTFITYFGIVIMLSNIVWIINNAVCCEKVHVFHGMEEYKDAIYYVMTTFTTVGYGDIVPDRMCPRIYTYGQIAAMFVQFISVFALIIFVSTFFADFNDKKEEKKNDVHATFCIRLRTAKDSRKLAHGLKHGKRKRSSV